MCHGAEPCCNVAPWDYLIHFCSVGSKAEKCGIAVGFLGNAGRVGKLVQVVSEVERGSEKEEGGFLYGVIQDSSRRSLHCFLSGVEYGGASLGFR